MLCEEHRDLLVDLAKTSIRYGIETGHPMAVDTLKLEEPLRAIKATFVTIMKNEQLRGCIGTLKACQPVATDVAMRAFGAAFKDPRFSPITVDEFYQIKIHVAVLQPPTPFKVESEAHLIDELQPGIDGLTLQEDTHSGTFLPEVWNTFPRPREFLQQLKVKAGLPKTYWSNSMSFSRYCVESFGDSH